MERNKAMSFAVNVVDHYQTDGTMSKAAIVFGKESLPATFTLKDAQSNDWIAIRDMIVENVANLYRDALNEARYQLMENHDAQGL